MTGLLWTLLGLHDSLHALTLGTYKRTSHPRRSISVLTKMDFEVHKAKATAKLATLLIFLQWCLDIILGLTLGYMTRSGWNKDKKESRTVYGKSAQVVDVRFNGGVTPGVEDSLDDCWLYTHNKYVNPEYVLKDDNIILMGMDHERAWFSVTPPEVRNDSIPLLRSLNLLPRQSLTIWKRTPFCSLLKRKNPINSSSYLTGHSANWPINWEIPSISRWYK